ncbi:MAG: Stf0 family sulfotransferase [Pseudomonadota bacterium]
MPTLPFASYIICTSPRSGSTMLCKLLAATKAAGNPGSLFHNPTIDAWCAYYGLDAAAYPSKQKLLEAIFSAAKVRGKGGTDVFGLRLQRGSFAFFMQQLGFLHPGQASDLARLEAAFGPTLFIYLTRDDKLDQAISCVRAEQSGLWHRNSDGSELERTAPPRDAGFDADAIKAHMDEFSAFETAWQSWFETQGISPLTVTYDRLSREPQAILTEIVSALGLDASIAADVPVQTAKMADETSLAWRTRFEAAG